MDLMGGRCVRLRQGRFEAPTAYAADPEEALAGFAAAGAGFAHVVDLDGARAGAPRQHDLIAGLAKAPLALQVAGGVREADHIARLLDAGAARVAVGSLAVTEPGAVADFMTRFGPDRITLALDVDISDGVPRVAVKGWSETTAASLWDVIAHYPAARHLLITDIGRDGMMTGPNLALIAEAVARLPGVAIQASGGVSGLDDLEALAGAGAAGAIVGKALWEGAFTLQEAIARAGA